MDFITNRLARVIYAIPFAVFGTMHLKVGPKMVGIVPAWLPAHLTIVYVMGVAMIAAALAIMFNRASFEASIGLALMLLTFILTIWIPMLGSADNTSAMSGLLKDTGLLGGALMVAGLSRNKTTSRLAKKNKG